jgi:hypothetical protein
MQNEALCDDFERTLKNEEPGKNILALFNPEVASELLSFLLC